VSLPKDFGEDTEMGYQLPTLLFCIPTNSCICPCWCCHQQAIGRWRTRKVWMHDYLPKDFGEDTEMGVCFVISLPTPLFVSSQTVALTNLPKDFGGNTEMRSWAVI
jgi:hypothetical protein